MKINLKVIFYSTHCPKCTILERKLKDKNIEYDEVNDIELMISKGFMNVPVLEIDGKVMNYGESIKWINEREGN